MSLLEQIKEPVAGEISRYEAFIRQMLATDHGLTRTMLDYVLASRGKALRPTITLLTASMMSREDQLPEQSLIAASLIEMTHTASLVHDDIIDEAFIRRGKPSVSALWRSPRAVIIGDYILAKSFSTGLLAGAFKITTYITQAMTELCEGELIQSDQSDKLDMTREIYNRIIYKKTASLIGRSAGVGAISVEAPEQDVDKMKTFGDSIGMAFQIKDDILDYTGTAKTGKPVCNDLRERKITLPLLTVLEGSPASERRELLALLADARNDSAKVEKLCAIVIEKGGLRMAQAAMNEHLTLARSIIRTYPESKYRDSLELLCDYFAQRDM